MTRPPKHGTDWARDEVVLALALYCQIPFAHTRSTNPQVARLSELLGRTPGSVARKLGNLGSLDPKLSERGITGLPHGSKVDRAVWGEFDGRWQELVLENERLLAQTGTGNEELLGDEVAPTVPPEDGPTEREVTTKARLHQAFFRRAVLASYQSSCCFCRIGLPELLIASHIVPWAVDETVRADPRNGLCLCALHDRAFDRGLMAVDSDTYVIVSSEAMAATSEFAQIALAGFAGVPVQPPQRFHPRAVYLQWHRENVYRG